MKRWNAKGVAGILAVIFVLGMGAYALADGYGYGYGPGSGYMRGWHRGMMDWDDRPHMGFRGGRGYYGGPADNLTAEQRKSLEQEQQAFFDATRDLRDRLYQKRLELRAELAKQAPDAAKASDLRKEVSGLRGELDQKRLDHTLKMRKLLPESDAYAGYGYGGRMRNGYGYGPGYCWR